MYGEEQRKKDIQVRIDVILNLLKKIDEELDDATEPEVISKYDRRKTKLYERWTQYNEELARLSESEGSAITSPMHKNKEGKPGNQPKDSLGLTPEAAAAIASLMIQLVKSRDSESESD